MGNVNIWGCSARCALHMYIFRLVIDYVTRPGCPVFQADSTESPAARNFARGRTESRSFALGKPRIPVSGCREGLVTSLPRRSRTLSVHAPRLGRLADHSPDPRDQPRPTAVRVLPRPLLRRTEVFNQVAARLKAWACLSLVAAIKLQKLQ